MEKLSASYSETIEWLFSQFPAYHNLGAAAYNPGLKNIEELLAFFDNPQIKLRFIHVGGTNGKGSTSNYLASIFQEASYKVGLFTSPHILDFRERIRVNGIVVPENFVIDFCHKVKSNSWTIQPSFFEITWAMALLYFYESNCDIVIAEVGLGGRLDATNVILPELSIITNIGLDHQNILGDTREKIAYEKAGIIKTNIPTIIGEKDEETKKAFQSVVSKVKGELLWTEDFSSPFENKFIAYQKLNAKSILLAVHLLNQKAWKISDEAITRGIEKVGENTGFFGRFQILHQEPLTILDCAHNADGIRTFLNSVATQGRVFCIYGTSSDKNCDEIIPLLPKQANWFFTEFSSNRTMKKSDLTLKFKEVGKNPHFFDKVEEAWSAVQNIVNKQDTILIFGSFFLVHDFFSFFSSKRLAE